MFKEISKNKNYIYIGYMSLYGKSKTILALMSAVKY